MPMVLPDHPHPSQDRSRSSPPPNRRSREYRTSDMQQYLISEYQPGAPFPRLTSSTMWGYAGRLGRITRMTRSEEHTSELQSLMRISYAGFCLKKKKNNTPKDYIISDSLHHLLYINLTSSTNTHTQKIYSSIHTPSN